jgi:hypothetical protein
MASEEARAPIIYELGRKYPCVAECQINKKSSVIVSPERWLPTVNVYHHVPRNIEGPPLYLIGNILFRGLVLLTVAP